MSELPGASFLPLCVSCGYPTAAAMRHDDEPYCIDCHALGKRPDDE